MEQEKKQPDVRLIGLDLDGTTLTSDKVLTPHTKEVLEKCLAEGIQVLPATGRAVYYTHLRANATVRAL